MKKAILVIGAVIVLGGGAALLLSKQTNDQAEVVTTSAPTPQSSAAATPATNEVTVRLTAAGFEPKAVTVKAGQSIAFITDIRARISSDPHPVHTSNQELNLPTSEAGQTVRLSPTKTGTYGVHNHLDESQQMTITVQ